MASGDPGVVHVHGLGINPADNTLFAATHTGLFRIANNGRAERVGPSQDTMGFTVAGPDHFLGSGHPDLRDLRSGKFQPLLGLVESTDAGRTWHSLSLPGKTDFHVLRFRHGLVYGFDSTSAAFMVSPDGKTWDSRINLRIADFTVSPDNADILIATVDTGLLRSANGGRSWQFQRGQPMLLLAWPQADLLWALDSMGALHASADGGTTWVAKGQLGGAPEAFLAANGKLYAAVHEKGILVSDDGGASWRVLYQEKR